MLSPSDTTLIATLVALLAVVGAFSASDFAAAVTALRHRGVRGRDVILLWLACLGIPVRDREDVAQRVIMKAFAERDRFDPAGNSQGRRRAFDRWLTRVAVEASAGYHLGEGEEQSGEREVAPEPREVVPRDKGLSSESSRATGEHVVQPRRRRRPLAALVEKLEPLLERAAEQTTEDEARMYAARAFARVLRIDRVSVDIMVRWDYGPPNSFGAIVGRHGLTIAQGSARLRRARRRFRCVMPLLTLAVVTQGKTAMALAAVQLLLGVKWPCRGRRRLKVHGHRRAASTTERSGSRGTPQ